jgi:hypothetical protein
LISANDLVYRQLDIIRTGRGRGARLAFLLRLIANATKKQPVGNSTRRSRQCGRGAAQATRPNSAMSLIATALSADCWLATQTI